MTDKEKLNSLVNENVNLIKHFYVDIHLYNSGDEIGNTIEHIEKIMKELYPEEVILAKEKSNIAEKNKLYVMNLLSSR